MHRRRARTALRHQRPQILKVRTRLEPSKSNCFAVGARREQQPRDSASVRRTDAQDDGACAAGARHSVKREDYHPHTSETVDTAKQKAKAQNEDPQRRKSAVHGKVRRHVA